MIRKTAAILKTARMYWDFHKRGATIGEIAKRTGYSKSTIRRACQTLANWGYLTCEIEAYKSTGKRVYTITEEGTIWIADYRELDLIWS